jgi:hypothetical protein
MRIGNVFCILIFVGFVNVLPRAADAFDITGGRPWADRTGPGVTLSLGFNNCLDEYCDDVWDTALSIGSHVGFYYQIIPNAAIYVDVHMGHIRSDMDGRDDDSGFMFQSNAGGEFHLPITGWVAPYFGFGIGFAYVGVWGDVTRPGFLPNDDFHHALFGFNFDLKFGANFYPFSRLPTFGLGPIFRFGFPIWTKACGEYNGVDECDDIDELNVGFNPMGIDDDDDPVLFFFGVNAKYGF